jgi:hypothetical protein
MQKIGVSWTHDNRRNYRKVLEIRFKNIKESKNAEKSKNKYCGQEIYKQNKRDMILVANYVFFQTIFTNYKLINNFFIFFIY